MPRKKTIPAAVEVVDEFAEIKTPEESQLEEKAEEPAAEPEPEVVKEDIKIDVETDIHYVSPEGLGDAQPDDAALLDLSPASIPEQEVLVTEKSRPPLDLPWWSVVLAAVIIDLILDSILAWLGSQWFWSERLLYTLSLLLIFLLGLLVAYFVCGRQQKTAKELVIINIVIALIVGCLLSINRFVHMTAFWTFFNLIGQPINALILSLAASWLGSKLFIKTKR